MYSTLYKKPDVELPYNVDTRYFKWVQDGQTKEKYEQKWIVLTSETNAFIENLSNTYNGLGITTPSREDRGPLTVVTVSYGDSELSENYNGDGELSWWTLSSGIYTYHIKRWVDNNPTDIKNFCNSCMLNYGYEKDEVSVSCNPVAGEPRVMCEATFTPDVETNEEDDPTTNPEWGENPEEEEDLEEDGESFSCSSTLDTLTPSAEACLEAKLGVHDGRTLVAIVNGVESGELVYHKSGDYGGRIKMDGWYSADDTNPNALDEPVYYDNGSDQTKDNVDKARVILKNIPDVVVPSLRVTVTSRVKSSNKVSMSALTQKMGKAGSMNQSISCGGTSLAAPAFTYGWDAQGTQYPINKTEWMDEGTSFDSTSVRKRSSLTTGKIYYEGTMSTSYRSISTLSAGNCVSTSSIQTL